MNLNKISLFVVVATLVLTGCNNDLVLQSETSEKAIEFVTVMDKTRASLVTEEELTSFFLHAGASGTGDLSFMNVAAYNNGSYENPDWTYAPKKYWPGYDLDFYAYAPIMDVNMTSKPEEKMDGTFEYLVPDDQSINNSAVDLLVAYAEEQGVTKNSGSVDLTFEHALSSVNFSAKIKSEFLMICKIQSIVITNLYNEGKYIFNTGKWEISGNNLTNYIAGIPESGVTIYPGEECVHLLSPNDYLMVLPQDIIGADVSVKVNFTYIDLMIEEPKSFGAIESYKTSNEFFLNNITSFKKGECYNLKFELVGNTAAATRVPLSVAIDNSVGNDGHDEEVTE